jgi:hypothetical protein
MSFTTIAGFGTAFLSQLAAANILPLVLVPDRVTDVKRSSTYGGEGWVVISDIVIFSVPKYYEPSV